MWSINPNSPNDDISVRSLMIPIAVSWQRAI
jgi:hypothetical protein